MFVEELSFHCSSSNLVSKNRIKEYVPQSTGLSPATTLFVESYVCDVDSHGKSSSRTHDGAYITASTLCYAVVRRAHI